MRFFGIRSMGIVRDHSATTFSNQPLTDTGISCFTPMYYDRKRRARKARKSGELYLNYQLLGIS